MRNQVRLKKIESFMKVYSYSTVNMTIDEYIQCWSAASYLASKPALFEQLMTALGNKAKIRAAIPAIYRIAEDKLTQDWLNYAKKVN